MTQTGFNVATHFVDRHVAEERGDAIAFYCEDRTLTYRHVHDLVNRTGNVLRELGVGMEQRVLLLCLDGPEFLGAFWGAIKIGAVPVPVNTMLRAADYLYFLEDSRARVAVVSAPLLAEAGPALAQASHLRHVLVAGGNPGTFLSYEDRVAKASPVLEAAPTSRDDAAFWLYSSGSTGFPKGAVHRHHDMVVCTDTYARQVLEMRETDRVFSAAKLFFAYGLGNANYFPMGVGAESVLYPHRPTPDAVFEVITRHRPTLFFGVPTLYAAMLAMKDAERRFDLGSLRLCVSAGEALPAELYTRWRDRFGVEIVDGIGTTEILHIFMSNMTDALKPGSSGKVVPGYDAKVVDDDGRLVKPGEAGHLLVRGDSTMPFYWHNHEKSKATVVGDWIRTGDWYRVGEDGFYYCEGRSDDMMKVGGLWVSPIEVENVLIEHPAVVEAAVVGVPVEGLNRMKAYVILREGHAGSAALVDELQKWCKERLQRYEYPHIVEFVPDLPKTITGKIQRFKLREPQPAPSPR